MVSITSRKIFDKLRHLTSVSWSLFTIGEPLTIEIEFEVFTLITFNANSPLQFGHAPTANSYAIANNSGRLAGINVGDSLRIHDGVATWNVNVTAVISSNLVITDFDFVNYSSSSSAYIHNVTPITGVAMPYNWIENTESINFNSKIDGTFQKLYAGGLDASNTTPVDMVFEGLFPYQVGGATIEGVSWDTANGKQKFKIIHETVVTPIYLATQLTEIQAGIRPAYYFNARCLKHIYNIEAYANIANPNTIQLGNSPTEIGNSGWFNEVFNGSNADYKLVNITYDTGLSTTLKLSGQPQIIEFDIVSPNGDWTAPTTLEFGFCKIPNNVSEYTFNTRNFEQNFLFTNTPLDTSLTPVTPSTVGTAYQTITEVFSEILDVNTIHVTCTVILSSTALLILKESLTPRFLFWATISNPSLTTAGTQNKQALYDNVVEFENLTITELLYTLKTYKRHYEDNADAGIVGNVTTFKNDECTMQTQIALTPALFPLTTKITSIANQIVAKKTDGTEFIIEDFTVPITYMSSGGIQIINYSNQRVFQIPTTEIRKMFTISGGVLTGGKILFDINFPFMTRWEYWVALASASLEFYDVLEPNNGLNNDWFRYQNVDWKIYHRITTNLTYDNIPMVFSQDTEIEINDYETNPDFTTKEVETFTLAGASLYDSANARWYIQSFANTIVKATFVKNIAIDINLCYVVFGIEIFEQGGIGGRQRYSSKWQTSNPLTNFIPFTSGIGNRVKLEQPTSDTIVAKAIIDSNLLPIGNITYTIVARLYENDGSAGNKITEDEIDKETEDTIIKIIE